MHATISRTILTVDGIRAPLLEARLAGARAATRRSSSSTATPAPARTGCRFLERAGRLARAAAWDHPGFGRAAPARPPTLVVWGRNDPYIPVEQAERQRQTFPSARVVVLDRSGHWPFVDDLEGVAGPVLPFLREMTEAPARHGP